MKKAIFLFIISVLLSSCEKTIQPTFPENPSWLNQKITELESGPSYGGIKIDVFIWKDEYYYHILNPISSCLFCEFYTYQGEKIVWQVGMQNDFFKNGRFLGCIWKHKESSIKSFPIENSYPIRRMGIDITED